MMLDWNDYHRQVLATLADIGRLTPDTLRGYRSLSDAGKKADHLGPKTRELIALAVAVTVRCDASMADVTLLGVPGTRSFTAASTEVIDTYRSDGP